MNDTPLKIVMVVRDPIGTGGGEVALQTISRMVEQCHDIVVVTDYSIPSLDPRIRQVMTIFGSKLHAWKANNKLLKIVRHNLQLFLFTLNASIIVKSFERAGYISVDHNIESGGGNVLILHNVFHAQYINDSRKMTYKIPQFFNPVFTFRLIRERIALRSARSYFAIGVSEKTCEEGRCLSRNDLQFRTIHNGIDLETFKPTSDPEREMIRNELGVDDQFIVLFIGHEFQRKRLDLAIKALVHCDPKCSLWVVGGRYSNEEEYRALATELGVVNRVKFWGTQYDTTKYLLAADCFLLPSDYETWGMVVLEAMACGTPPIMTRVGCASAVIRDGETGFLIDSDENSVAQRLMSLMNDPTLLKKMSIDARKEAENHDWDHAANAYLQVIRQVQYMKGEKHDA